MSTFLPQLSADFGISWQSCLHRRPDSVKTVSFSKTLVIPAGKVARKTMNALDILTPFKGISYFFTEKLCILAGVMGLVVK